MECFEYLPFLLACRNILHSPLPQIILLCLVVAILARLDLFLPLKILTASACDIGTRRKPGQVGARLCCSVDVGPYKKAYQRKHSRQQVNPKPSQDRTCLSCETRAGLLQIEQSAVLKVTKRLRMRTTYHQARVECHYRQLFLRQALESSVKRIGPQDIGQLTGSVTLPARIFLSLSCRMSELLGSVVNGVRKAGFLSWIMCPARCDDDASVICDVWKEKVK